MKKELHSAAEIQTLMLGLKEFVSLPPIMLSQGSKFY
jgi:hypothetical protein